MFELIPSKYMRNYLKEKGHEFTDFQKATLIWNTPLQTWNTRLGALEELVASTQDEVLKRQISQRLEVERRKWNYFLENQNNRFVYVVEEEAERSGCGYFAQYDKAHEYALRYMREYETICSIKKHFIIREKEDEIVRNPARWNPNIMDVEEKEFVSYCGDEVGEIYLDANGGIRNFWSNELSKAEESVADKFNLERFENAFFKIPFEMQAGAIVQNVINKRYGVLACGKEEWEKYIRMIDERNLYVDFMDLQVKVYELRELGYWSHDHVNPLHLEFCVPDQNCEKEKEQAYLNAARMLGNYIKAKSLGADMDSREVFATAKQYAKLCRMEKLTEFERGMDRNLAKAENVEDILF